MAVPHRSLEETMAERGIDVGHATLIRRVEKYASIIATQAHRRKTKAGRFWQIPPRAIARKCPVRGEATLPFSSQVAGHISIARSINTVKCGLSVQYEWPAGDAQSALVGWRPAGEISQ
ncbi:MAG: hypothetical protein ABJL72_21785 [Roseobacter sp.]